VPYRIDIAGAPPDVLDILVQWGALDLEALSDGLAAILPDAVAPDTVTASLAPARVTFSPAVARDSGSVWLLGPRAVRIGGVRIAPPDASPEPGTLRLADSTAFGTGHHPTTALCGEALQEILAVERPDCILDIGTGSGILALSALLMGVPQAVGVDIDPAALEAAAQNARLNHLADRLRLVPGGPDAVEGTWPLVVANILAAPLIEMAPTVVRRLGSRGRLILSGIPWSVASEVRDAYRHLGVRHVDSRTRAGWTVLIVQASW
jgi:ribosomal protein L11 methyltransferase